MDDLGDRCILRRPLRQSAAVARGPPGGSVPPPLLRQSVAGLSTAKRSRPPICNVFQNKDEPKTSRERIQTDDRTQQNANVVGPPARTAWAGHGPRAPPIGIRHTGQQIRVCPSLGDATLWRLGEHSRSWTVTTSTSLSRKKIAKWHTIRTCVLRVIHDNDNDDDDDYYYYYF